MGLLSAWSSRSPIWLTVALSDAADISKALVAGNTGKFTTQGVAMVYMGVSYRMKIINFEKYELKGMILIRRLCIWAQSLHSVSPHPSLNWIDKSRQKLPWTSASVKCRWPDHWIWAMSSTRSLMVSFCGVCIERSLLPQVVCERSYLM